MTQNWIQKIKNVFVSSVWCLKFRLLFSSIQMRLTYLTESRWPKILRFVGFIRFVGFKRFVSFNFGQVKLLRFVVVMVRSNSFGHLDVDKWINPHSNFNVSNWLHHQFAALVVNQACCQSVFNNKSLLGKCIFAFIQHP